MRGEEIRNALAKAIYDNDCEIAAKIADDGMPLVPWEQFKRDNPESAMVTGTFAAVYLAAVAPLIRAAALEEAAGVVRDVAMQWRAQTNTAVTHGQRTTFADREAGAMTALAAIRALKETPV